ncbi:hypothetical protein MSAN_00501100 [Mycena sanguinolenta]|uniref:CxC1-like cysteine cluster associated with KDZ transposases domain-containing protein n=1 Tax=Mycena sanguinolenta TaxID=230812 RepID=A0A8H7DIV0_9AGAR|nr:hypothetical protein MSAN_00501100 [Mycena sanguinolenta]
MADDFHAFGHPSLSTFFPSDRPSSPAKKQLRENQWHAWTYDVIPALVLVYMQLLHKTESLRNTEDLVLPTPPHCKCNKRTLAIAVIRMTRIEHISLVVCACSPAPASLLRAGLFGCSPRHPSLAVDLQVLDFVMALFLNVPPNNTVMANTLEGFLAKHGYKLATKDTLRVRFGNALEWYTSLCLATRAKIDQLLDNAREIALDFDDPNPATLSSTQDQPFDDLPPSSPLPASLSPFRGAASSTTQTPVSSPIRLRSSTTGDLPPSSPLPVSSSPIRGATSLTTDTPVSSPIRPHPSTTEPPTPRTPKRRRDAAAAGDEPEEEHAKNPFPEPPPHSSTTEPPTPRTPKRRRGAAAAGDKPEEECAKNPFPEPPSRSSTTEPQTPRTPKRRRDAVSADDEPREQERAKNPFPDSPPCTRPSAYLIRRCPACFGGLEHDPSQPVDIHVCGDACFNQKRRRNGCVDPCRTHPHTVFVPAETADQMGAYVEDIRPPKPKPAKQARAEEEEDGYEPGLKVPRSVLIECEKSFKAADENRKKASTKFFEDTGIMGLLCRHDRVLFLVNMRSTGEKQYYMLALIEMLFQHLPANIRVGILYDIACLLHVSCLKYDFLRRYLDRILFGYHRRLFTIDLQIEHADRASLGRLAGWLVRRNIHCEEKLREALADLKACGHSEAVLREHWKNQVEVQTHPLKRRAKKHGAAAVDQVLAARKASEAAFDHVKFLEETLADLSNPPHERVYAELNIDAARKSLKQAKEKAKQLERQLGIEDSTLVKKLAHSAYYELVQTYNKLCGQIVKLIRDKHAPKGAVAPPEIQEKGIYQLDVDDMIWQDLGLDEDDEEPPVWLTDNRVRSGIRAMFQKDRCEEEAPRLLRERRHLQIWFATEWMVVGDLIAAMEGGVRYQFELQRQKLLELYVHWKKSLDRIAFDDADLPEWGPTDAEVKACQTSNVTPSWVEEDQGNESDGGEWEEEDDEDNDIFQIVEAVERADNHRGGNEDADFWV